jgi:hypothetical protein
MAPNPFSSLPGVETEERSCAAASRAAEGEERGRGGPLALACVLGTVWLCLAMAVRFLLAGLPEWLTYRCLEIPKVSRLRHFVFL